MRYKNLLPKSVFFLITALFSSESTAQNQTIIVGWGEFSTPPYAIIENDILVRGIIPDIASLMADPMNFKAEYIKLPRNRIEGKLLDGSIDITCIANPDWWPSLKDDAIWSESLFKEKNVFATRSDSIKLEKPEDLDGKSIATVLGFRYGTDLTSRFENAKTRRDDAGTVEASLKKVILSRADAAVANNIVLRYNFKKDEFKGKLSQQPLSVGEYDIHCMGSKKSSKPIESFFKVLSDAKKKGEIEKIIDKYIN